MKNTFVTENENDTVRAGVKIGKNARPGDVYALFGDLGAGKTAFVRGMAEGMGITERVTSPTFALVHEYGDKIKLYHFDMYRISGTDDLESTGWYDYLAGNGVIAVEWSENIVDALPDHCKKIIIERIDEQKRRITICDGE